MIYCGKCGKVNPDGTRFCGGCGSRLEEEVPVVVEPEKPENSEAKCWSVFAKIGFILSIVTIACASTFIFSSFALVAGQPALVFSILGRRTKKPSYHTKAKVGMILSIIGLALGFVLYIIYIIAIGNAITDGIVDGYF